MSGALDPSLHLFVTSDGWVVVGDDPAWRRWKVLHHDQLLAFFVLPPSFTAEDVLVLAVHRLDMA